MCTVRRGNYFAIPENPMDVEQLWAMAEPLRANDLPSWLTPEYASSYRLVRPPCIAAPAHGQHDSWRAEKTALEAAGFVIDEDPRHSSAHRIYVPAPSEDVWSIGIYKGRSPFDLHPAREVQNPVLTRQDVLDVPASFVADPFIITINNRWYMFFEVMNWQTGKGEIGLAESNDGFAWTYREIVLAEPFHLSYPYVFEWQGEYFMIPESFQAHGVRLYKAQHFPSQWSFVKQILEGPYLVDSSILRYRDKWWLFTETNPKVQHDCLRLYFADELTGPWIEHPKSPLIEGNPQSARPAGRVLATGDEMFRFAQDCSAAYGSSVNVFKITKLDIFHYAEEQVSSTPLLKGSGSGWNAGGMHHVDAHRMPDATWLACVDGWRPPTI